MTVAAFNAADITRWTRFVVSGAINTAVDFTIFAALVYWSILKPFGANLVAFFAAVTCSFVLNRFWTFRDRRFGSPVPFVIWMSAIALLSSWLLDRVIQLGVHLAVAKIGVTVLVIGVSYLVMSRLIFDSRRSALARLGGVGALGAVAVLNVLFPAGAETRGLPQDLLDLYQSAREPRQGPLKVYHLGHSLVGREMPAMLAQLAGEGHAYGLQLGWGTSLRQHLAGPKEILGYAVENDTPRFVPLEQALSDTSYDALIFTEMIGLREAVRYHGSADAVARLVRQARASNPEIALYLYETWHPINEGDWLARVPRDWELLWQPALLAPAIRASDGPVQVIPAGTIMARLVEKVETTPGGIGGMTRREDLFARDAEGHQDHIHLNDWGSYLVALAHYAVLYGKSPEGLPHRLMRSDGRAADAPSETLARVMQQIVWETVQSSPLYLR